MTNQGPGQLEIALEYARHTGPRFLRASVKLRFDSLRPYSFSSQATWPPGVDYTESVQSGVEEALMQRLGKLEQTEVTLLEVSVHPVDSAPMAFKRAARAATEAAFAV